MSGPFRPGFQVVQIEEHIILAARNLAAALIPVQDRPPQRRRYARRNLALSSAAGT